MRFTSRFLTLFLALSMMLLGACSKTKSVVFVVDTSGSMRNDNLIGDVKRSIKKLLLQYGEGDTVTVLTFDGETRLLIEKTLTSQEDTAAIFDAVDSVEAAGRWTDLVGALDASLKRIAELHGRDPGRTTLVLYTDGKHDPPPSAAGRSVADFADLVKAYYQSYRPGESWYIFYVELDESEPALKKFLEETGSGRVIARSEFASNLDFTEVARGTMWVALPAAGLAVLLLFVFGWFLPWLRNVRLVPVGAGGAVMRRGDAIPLESFRRGAFARLLGFGKPSDIHLSLGSSKVDVCVDSKGSYSIKPVSGQVVRVDGKVVTTKQGVKPGQRIQIGTAEYLFERSARKK